MTASDYSKNLKALIRSHVAFVVGTSDMAQGNCLDDSSNGDNWENNYCNVSGQEKWRRQKESIKYFQEELFPLLGGDYMESIILHPPQWHPTGASFPIENRSGRAANPISSKNVRFYWTPNSREQGHSGTKNYWTARQYLFNIDSHVSMPLIKPDPFVVYEAPINAYLEFGKNTDSITHRITFTTNKEVPSNSSEEFIPDEGQVISINRNTEIRARAFTKYKNLKTYETNGSSFSIGRFLFADPRLKAPNIIFEGQDNYSNDYILKVTLPIPITLDV